MSAPKKRKCQIMLSDLISDQTDRGYSDLHVKSNLKAKSKAGIPVAPKKWWLVSEKRSK